MNDDTFEKKILAFQRKVRRALRGLGVRTPKGKKRDVWRPGKRK
jgi:hypothetical protein